MATELMPLVEAIKLIVDYNYSIEQIEKLLAEGKVTLDFCIQAVASRNSMVSKVWVQDKIKNGLTMNALMGLCNEVMKSDDPFHYVKYVKQNNIPVDVSDANTEKHLQTYRNCSNAPAALCDELDELYKKHKTAE